MKKRQIDKKTTMQVRIDSGLHQLIKVKASTLGISIKTLIEGYLAEILAVDKGGGINGKK